jgi:epsilon-lactone hydrolase
VPSEELEFVNELLRSFSLEGLTVTEQRAAMERSASAPADGTLVEPADANGVPAEWVTAIGVTGTGVVLSLHGGAYAIGSLATNRRFSALVSAATNRRVLSIDYRLAPEHRFPAALDDSLTAYRWLLADRVAASDIVIAGNSAGGGLALATLVALRDHGAPLPGAAVAVSAWTDLTGSGDSVTSCAATDAMLNPRGLATSAAMYADAEQHENPLVSPLFADLHGLPPILLQASRAELLRDDTTRFSARARSFGVEVTEELYDDMPHVWHLFAGLLPEADHAFAAIGRWLSSVLPRT